MNNNQIQQLNEQITKLQNDVNLLSTQVNKNNFISHQDFTKVCTFTDTLKVPIFTTLPPCEVGSICAYSTGGTYKLMIATDKDTWTIVGTQS